MNSEHIDIIRIIKNINKNVTFKDKLNKYLRFQQSLIFIEYTILKKSGGVFFNEFYIYTFQCSRKKSLLLFKFTL